MGKIFVKGPVESPDDLLAKESRLGQAGRIGLDATQAAVNLTRPQSIQSFADLAGIPFNIARYFMEGKGKRQLSPTEQAYQKLLANRQAQEQFEREEALRQRDEERAENFRLLEVMSPSDDRKIAPLPEVSGLPFSQQRKDSKQALVDAMRERKEMYEKLELAQRLPSQEQAELNRIAAVKEKARRDVEAEDYRRGFRGQKQRGGEAVHGGAEELVTASDAAEPISLEETAEGLDPTYFVTPPVQPDTQAIADSGALSDDQNDGKNEIKRVEGMANEQNKNLGMNTVNEAIQQPKEPNFSEAPALPTDVSNQANIGDNFGLNADDLANIAEEQERRMRGEE